MFNMASSGGSSKFDSGIELTGGGTLSTTSNGNITLLPNGTGITIVGDAGSTSHSLATNDDLFVSGKLEVDGTAHFDGTLRSETTFVTVGTHQIAGTVDWRGTGVSSGAHVDSKRSEEVITVSNGTSTANGSDADLFPANSVIRAVAAYVVTPDGGTLASTFDVGRTNGGNLDEFIDAQSVLASAGFNHAAHSDGTLTYANMLQVSNDTVTVTLDANADTDVQVRVVVWYDQITAPTA